MTNEIVKAFIDGLHFSFVCFWAAWFRNLYLLLLWMHQGTGDGRYSASDLRNAVVHFAFVFLRAFAPHPPPSMLVGRLSGRGGGVAMEYILPVDPQVGNPNFEKGGRGDQVDQQRRNRNVSTLRKASCEITGRISSVTRLVFLHFVCF